MNATMHDPEPWPPGWPRALRQALAPTPRPPRRKLAPRRQPPATHAASRADILRTLAALPTATPSVEELADAIRIRPGTPERTELADAIRDMERGGAVETWPDPERPGRLRVMLSASTASRLGLALSRRGDRWEMGSSPDRPVRRLDPTF